MCDQPRPTAQTLLLRCERGAQMSSRSKTNLLLSFLFFFLFFSFLFFEAALEFWQPQGIIQELQSISAPL